MRLDPGAVPRGQSWLEGVNSVQSGTEEERVRECARRERPFGQEGRVKETASKLKLEFSLRAPGPLPNETLASESRLGWDRVEKNRTKTKAIAALNIA